MAVLWRFNMPGKAEQEKLISKCKKEKGWSEARCKRYVLGGIFGSENFMSPSASDVHVPGVEKKKKYDENEDPILRGVPVFKSGSFKNGDANFSIDDLDEIVKNTNSLISSGQLEPPGKLGHNESQELLKNDGLPAAGYVSKLYRLGDQIFADFINMPKKIADLFAKRAYSKISAEIYQDFEHPDTKEKIGKVLRAVAFLGADLPEIKGLGDISRLYMTENEVTVLSFSEKELEEANKMSKEWTIKEVESVMPCCVKDVEKYMEENKLKTIPQEKLAEVLANIKYKKFTDDCPPGFKWDEKAGQCIAASTNPQNNPERKVCPEGQKWDDAAQKCVPVKMDDKKEEKPVEKPVEKPAEDETKSPDYLEYMSKMKKIKGIKDEDKMSDEDEKLVKEMWDYMKDKMKPKEPAKMDDKQMDKKLDKMPSEMTPEELGEIVESYKKATPEQIKEINEMADEKRPPKGWFDNCVAGVTGKTDTPEQLCGWIYHHQMSPEAKAKAEATRQSEKPKEENPEVKQLKEQVAKLTNEKIDVAFSELKEKNRGILLPAFDSMLDPLMQSFKENDKVVKFGESEVSTAQLFMKFLKELASKKMVMFGEVIKKEEEEKPMTDAEKQEVIKKYSEGEKGVKGVSNLELSALAEKISKDKKIDFKEALSIAAKEIEYKTAE